VSSSGFERSDVARRVRGGDASGTAEPEVRAESEELDGHALPDFHRGRHAGVLLPLFAAPSTRSWGIGEIGDLPALCVWLGQAGFDVLQLLPVNEMASGDHSPYSAITAMAIDPIYISLRDVEDHAARGGDEALSSADRRRLEAARKSPRIDYAAVRALKSAALRAAFDRFMSDEWQEDSTRAARFCAYVAEQAWWLDDYALFRALRATHAEAAWWTWEDSLAGRDPDALARARRDLGAEMHFYQYQQWLAASQWRAAQRRAAPVGLFGDTPFVVGQDSADVWARQHAFDLGATVGVPPDAFSATGQNWSLPVYRWEVSARENDAWIRDRVRRAADLFAGFRVDHLVGYYRTYVIPRDGARPYFTPDRRPAQLRQGERLLGVWAGTSARVIAEDLGTVPNFVRSSLARLDLPGYRVLRWEREWDAPGKPFRDPVRWPALSVATSGTHDTESLAEWWDQTSSEDRRALGRIPALASAGFEGGGRPYDAGIRDALLELLFAAGSDLLILPLPDLFGWRDRINTPATVGAGNWTYRLPWPVDRLAVEPEARERAAVLRRWSRRHRRVAAASSAGERDHRARPTNSTTEQGSSG
jgi:4-alpha-glucanotransferase